ncbi:MAG: hypothetical protein Q8914_12190 [Bacteroidota bacterium]|nr:hypothetical protein [Bacteroidota bacterium]
MKHLLKTFLFLAAFAGFMTACDNSDDPNNTSGEAKLISFGFYAADNQGVLFQDYVVSDSTSTSWTINLPAEVDKSKLVARFVTTKNDSVTINGVGQVSGVTVNNFTVPVDYYLTDGTNNIRYTITVGKASAYTWSKLSSFTADSAICFTMKVNPVTSTPYILYKEDRATSTDQKAALIKWNGTNWEYVGNSAGLSAGRIGSYLDLTFDAAGKPYVAYPDYTTTTTAQKATVRFYNGTGWADAGQGITAGAVTYTALSFAPDNSLMLFNVNNAAAGGLAKRELGYSVYNGSAWTTSNTITGRTADMLTYLPVAKLVNGALYVGTFNQVAPSSFSVYKYQNGTWTTIADKMVEAGATNSNLRDFDMDVDKNGNIFIAIADNASDAAVYKPRVKKYTAATQTWSNVGDIINVSLEDIRHFDLAVSPYGIPYLMYRNANQYPVIISLDTDTQQWTSEVVLEQVEADDLWLDFAPNGEAFATFSKTGGSLTTYKYAAPAN